MAAGAGGGSRDTLLMAQDAASQSSATAITIMRKVMIGPRHEGPL